MTKWREALKKAASHLAAAGEAVEHERGWLPLCIAYRRVEEAERELAIVRAELDKTKDVQSWRTSGLRISIDG